VSKYRSPGALGADSQQTFAPMNAAATLAAALRADYSGAPLRAATTQSSSGTCGAPGFLAATDQHDNRQRFLKPATGLERGERIVKAIRRLLNYLAAAIFAGVALIARAALDPWLGDAQPLSLLFGAIALSVWYGGAGPALLAAIVGYLAGDYLFIPPRGVFALVDVQEAIGLGTYLAACAIIIGFGQGLRSANRRALEYAKRLEDNQARLELAEVRKDAFLATLAHELRSPLAPIRNAVSLLIPREPELGTARGIIDRQSQHLIRLVNDLLDMSRVRAGRLRIQKDTIELAPVLRHAIEAARPQIDAAGHALSTTIPPEPIFLNGDATRLTQVFSNLLNNAARYTPRGGHISLEVHRDDNQARIVVRDDGIGTPSDMLPHIFEMFLQGDRPAERAGEGLGIGLALVRTLLQLHDGSVEARSDGANCGSEFVVQLPVLAAVPNRFAGVTRPTALVVPREDVSILIVASDPRLAERVASPCSALGFTVQIAATETEAIRVGARTRPRAVLVDLRAEEMHAGALCGMVRRYAWGQRALLVGLTSPNQRLADSLRDVLDAHSVEASALIQTILERLPSHQGSVGPRRQMSLPVVAPDQASA
jgi:signal transduction histidine kinase